MIAVMTHDDDVDNFVVFYLDFHPVNISNVCIYAELFLNMIIFCSYQLTYLTTTFFFFFPHNS